MNDPILTKKTDFKDIMCKYIFIIKQKMKSDEFIFLKEHNNKEYLRKLNEFVPEFKDQYPSLFKMIISDVNIDLSMLDIFLNNLTDIDDGKKSLDDVRNNLGHMLHNKYVKKNLK